MAALMNSGESDMATEDFCLNLSPLPSPRWSPLCLNLSPLPSPRWSPLCLTPSPPRPFLPSSNSNYSMVMQYQGSNKSMDNPLQNQRWHEEDMVDLAPYLARDSALLQQQQLRQNWSEASDWGPGGGIMRMNMVESQSNNQGFEEWNMGFEESEEMMTSCFYFPPSPTDFPMYRPTPSVFFVSSQQDISLALSCQHIFEDKSSALHVIKGVERHNVVEQLLDGVESYLENKFGDWDQIARAAGVVPKGMESLVDNIRRINWLEQHDEDIVDQPVFEQVIVVQQLIQNRGGELDMILGGGVSTINRLEHRDRQGLPTTQETLLICQAKFFFRVWLGHGSQWAAELRYNCNRLKIGSFTTVEDAILAYKVVGRWSGWKDLTRFPGLFGNENRSKLSLQLPQPEQEEKPDEEFGLVWCNATGNDEIEVVRTGSARTGDCVMADQAQLNSGCLGKRKTNGKNSGRERRNKKTNGVRIAIPLEDISQTKGMRLKDVANHLGVSKPKLKTASRDYGIQRWPPRQKQELIRQSYPNESSVIVDEEGISQLNYDTLPSDQPLVATIDTNSGVVIKIHPPQFLPKARQENPDGDFGNYEVEVVGMGVEGTREGEMEEDEDFGNYEVEAVGMGVERTGEGEMEEGQLNSGCLEKGKSNVETPGGDRGNKKINGIKIAISLEDILQAERMYLEETGKQMSLDAAAKKFKVSRSTLKRVCRKYGILSWPPSKGNEHISQSRPKESPAVVDQKGVQQLNCDIPPFDQAWAAIVDTNSVVLKARWVDDIILKIRLPKPWKMAELGQQVEKRLKLESGTYYIRYKDEENEFITILCDEDLQEYISSSRPLDTSSIEVFLVPK